MATELFRLKQVLELEKSRDFDNGAVFGGLDRFLGNWLNTNLVHVTNLADLARLRRLWPPGFSYALLPPDERRKWSRDVISFFSDQSGKKVPGTGEPRAKYESAAGRDAVPPSGKRRGNARRLPAKTSRTN